MVRRERPAVPDLAAELAKWNAELARSGMTEEPTVEPTIAVGDALEVASPTAAAERAEIAARLAIGETLYGDQ